MIFFDHLPWAHRGTRSHGDWKGRLWPSHQDVHILVGKTPKGQCGMECGQVSGYVVQRSAGGYQKRRGHVEVFTGKRRFELDLERWAEFDQEEGRRTC